MLPPACIKAVKKNEGENNLMVIMASTHSIAENVFVGMRLMKKEHFFFLDKQVEY